MKTATALLSAFVLLAYVSIASAALGAYSLQDYKQTSYGFTGQLTLSTQPSPNYGPAISPLQLDVYLETADRVRIKISDPNNARWEVPQSILPTPTVSSASSSQNYQVLTTSSPFGIAVVRSSDNVVMFNTTTNGIFNSLVFSDQYLEVSTALPVRANLYGLGEHIDPLRVDGSGSNGHTYTFWARDNGTPFDANLYGSHPFYIEMRNGRAHGVFLKNSNGMDVVYYDGANTGSAYLTYKVIGGILDFYVFDGPSPGEVTQQYQALVGTPHMPPYWSLGWHQCRWGYNTINDVEHVVSNYAANNIPLDTMWTDIDYMQNYEDFSWDPTRYPQSQVASFVQSLHQNGQQYVVIVDPAIHNRTGYQPFMDGLSMDIFIKDSSGKPYIGEVWPGSTAFPDFLHPNGTVYWNNQVTRWLDGVPVDGMWIDMNEASNFLNVAKKPQSAKSRPNPVDTSFSPNNPPYAINNAPNHAPLNTHGLGPELTHYGGVLEYNVHNLYGISETIATRKTLEAYYNKRSLVISRSTFPGSGTHGGHWLGDNDSDFVSMRYSVPGILDMNIFGIPLVGADICGFGGNTTEELCSRWMELGAFYPFARNHNSIGSAPQEPYVWPSVAAISRKVLGARYSLLPYYYTLFYLSNTYGGTVARPLFFEFPTDAATLPIDEQFLIGSALMVSPVLGQGQTTVDVYFPPASQWYDFWTFTPVSVPGWQTLTSAIDQIQVHIRGGNIIPSQIPGLTTAASRQNSFQLIVALDANAVATGALFLDDGSTLNFASDSHFISFTASSGSVSSQVIRSPDDFVPPKEDAVSQLRERARSAYLRNSGKPAFDYKTTFPSINQISVLGVTATPTQVCVNGACSAQFSYNQALQLLTIPSLSLSPVTAFQVTYH